MVKIVCLFLFIGFSTIVWGQDIDLRAIRNDFNKGVKDEALCTKYYELLTEKAETPVEKGYQAAFHMFMAKHTGNPIKKMSYFKNGKKMLEKQINADSDNVELRFIRLCIQYHTPKYLGYHDNVEQDKQYMLDHLYKMPDKETKALIYKYLKGANMYSESELALLRR